MYYAQMQEDITLRRFFPDKHDGFYIDVGAWDAETDSVTKHFYDAGWTGINIEPIPDYFERVALRRPNDINLQIACGAANETRVLNYIHGSGLSSFDSAVAQRSQAKTGFSGQPIFVTSMRLEKVWDLYVPPKKTVDFLKVDVEGWECDVIAGMNFKRHRPRVLIVEVTEPLTHGDTAIIMPWAEQLDRDLVAEDYRYYLFDGLNNWYVDRHWNACPVD